MASPVVDVDASLTDPTFFAGSAYHELFAHLRAEDPVHWTTGTYERGYWSVTRYEDCVTLLSDAELFSSSAGTHLPPSGRDMTPTEDHEMGKDAHIIMTDPPLHGPRRRPMNKHMSVPVVSHMRPLFTQIVTEILDAAEAKESRGAIVDLVEDIAAQMPVKVILRLLGAPESDWEAVRDMSSRSLHTQDEDYLERNSDAVAVTSEYINKVNEYVLGLVRDRRVNPTDDYATIIAQLRKGDELFTEREASFMAVGFVLGGLEGTRSATSVGLMELIRRPEQARRLVGDPALAKSAVEEVLRWTTPSKNRLRVATADTQLAGRSIRKGDWVVGWITSANRDPEAFQDPGTFDIARTPNKHLSFGLGTHSCLGRAMARLEMEIMLPMVFERFPDIAMLAEPDWIVSDNATGLKALPVRLKS